MKFSSENENVREIVTLNNNIHRTFKKEHKLKFNSLIEKLVNG